MYGLVGGGSLAALTSLRILGVFFGGEVGFANLLPLIGLVIGISALGFVCGLIVWSGIGVTRRFGTAGDAMLGATVMAVYFLGCMLATEPALLGSKFRIGGLPMLVLAAVIGSISGLLIGRATRHRKPD